MTPFFGWREVERLVCTLYPRYELGVLTAISQVANISVRVGERFEISQEHGGSMARRIPTVEVWIGGRRFVHDCLTDEEARDMVFKTAVDLGL